jgi:nitric oxide reductase NorQ protein
MTTTTPIITPASAEIDTLYPDLTSLIFGVAVQNLDPKSVPAGLVSLMPSEGRASLRAKQGDSKTPKETKVKVETLKGMDKYPRPNGQDYYSRSWGEHSDIEVLRKARTLKQFILLYGSPGCGKTALVEGAFPDELETIIGTGDTEVSDFVGSYVQTPSGGFEWIDGPLTRAVEQGKVLLIDEVGLIDPKVLSLVYGLMDGRDELTITQNPERGTIKAKSGFYVIGATNPNAIGVRLSEALLSRFSIQTEMTTDWALAKKLGVPAPAVTASQNLSKKQQTGEISWSPQFRELLAFRDVAKTFGTAWAVSNLVACSPENDRAVVADVFTRVFGEEVKSAKI